MFLVDELEYARLKRNDNIMGWLAIVFVAALVFMFAGVMNSASATNYPSAPRSEATTAAPQQSSSAAEQGGTMGSNMITLSFTDVPASPDTPVVASIQAADLQTTALAARDDNAGVAHAATLTLADHDIKTGALLLSLALMGGSFVMLTFGGPRSGPGGNQREDEDMVDAL